MTQAELAAAVGLRGATQVWVWEHGGDRPSARTVPRLAGALGIPAIELFDVPPGAVPLRVLRLVAGLTLTELAAQAGLSYRRCQNIERGAMAARDDEIPRLAAALGVAERAVTAAATR